MSRPAESTAPARIFVIDDDDVMLLSCRRILERDGYAVETFDNGHEGLTRLETVKPQLILVDLKMPELDGLQVIQRIRGLDPDLVIAVITGYATIATAVDAMKAGAYDFLPKPFTPDELRLVVTRGCERWRLANDSKRLRHEKEAAERRIVTFLTHQLKSPLAAAKQYLDVLAFTSGTELPPKAAEWIARSQARLEEMLILIDDWLTLANVERGAVSHREASTELPAVISQVAQAAAPHAERSRVTVTTSVDPGIPPVCGDAGSVATVISNLVINGIKYNHPSGEVTLRAAREGEMARVDVTDNGIGIPEESLPRIFEEFYRVGNGAARDVPGSGLGLAICRRIVEELGGSIEAASTLGSGSTFTVRLPLATRTGSQRAA
jgi:two-component system, sensor histidine kinase and response regulator